MEQQQPMLQAGGGPQDIIQAEINQQLEYLRLRTQKTGEECRRIEQEQEAFALQYHECTKLNGTRLKRNLQSPESRIFKYKNSI